MYPGSFVWAGNVIVESVPFLERVRPVAVSPPLNVEAVDVVAPLDVTVASVSDSPVK